MKPTLFSKDALKNIIQSRFLTSSLQKKLFSALLVTILSAMALMSIISSLVMGSYTKNIVTNNTKRILSQGGLQLSGYFQSLSAATLVPYSNTQLYALISAANPVFELEHDTYYRIALASIYATADGITQTHLYCHNTGMHYLGNNSSITRSYSPENAPDGDIHPVSLHEPHLSSSHGIYTMSPSTANTMVVTLRRHLFSIPQNNYMGYLDIDIAASYLDRLLEQLRIVEQGETSFLLHNGSILYSYGEEELIDQDQDWLSQIPDTGSGLIDTRTLFNRQFILYEQINASGLDLMLVKCIPFRNLNTGMRLASLINWVTCVTCLCICALLISSITNRYTLPITQLATHMKKVGSGQIHESIHIERDDEIGILYESFQTMMDNINDLILKQYELELSNKNNQIYALQAQLNPHFINNTMQSIGAVALNSGSTEVYHLLSSFGSMMHYCMDFSSHTGTIGQELDYVANYLFLQKLRFPERFIFTIHAEDVDKNYIVPKMLLQPLVENCFKHGNIQDHPAGFVALFLATDNGLLNIRIVNNGDDCPAERMLELQRQIEDPGVDYTNHVGILNTATRLRLIYEGKASIRLKNRDRGGFIVELILPIMEEL